jgi:hypothetical protein
MYQLNEIYKECDTQLIVQHSELQSSRTKDDAGQDSGTLAPWATLGHSEP